MSKKVKFVRITALLLVFCGFSGVSYAQDTLKLTLESALEIALSENLTVKVADKEITRLEYAKKGSYAALYPKIDFSTGYQRTIAKQTMYLGDQEIQVGTDNMWNAGFNAGMPIVSAELWKSLKISEMDVELSVEKARASKIDMINQVQQAYYGVLLAKDSYEVIKENYDNAVRNYNDIKQKYESGTSSKYDMISAEVTANNAAPNMYDAQNNIILAKWKLKALIGIDLSENIDCEEQLADFESTIMIDKAEEDVSLANNTNLKQLEMQLGILDESYKMKLAKFYPTLNLSISYQWTSMNNDFKFSTYKWNPYSVGGLTLSIPIFSGGDKYYGLKQTRVQQEQLKMQKESLRRDLEVQTKQTLNTMSTSSKQYIAAQSGIDGAEAGYEISEKRYEVGSGTQLELDASRLALLNAKLNLYQSIYNYLIGKSTLEMIVGEQMQQK